MNWKELDLEGFPLRELFLILSVMYLLQEQDGRLSRRKQKNSALVMAFAGRAWGNQFFIDLAAAMDFIEVNKRVRRIQEVCPPVVEWGAS
jgi:hypothetical protein